MQCEIKSSTQHVTWRGQRSAARIFRGSGPFLIVIFTSDGHVCWKQQSLTTVYRLPTKENKLPYAGNKRKIDVPFFRLQQTTGSCCFLSVTFFFCTWVSTEVDFWIPTEVWNFFSKLVFPRNSGNIETWTWRHGDLETWRHRHGVREMEKWRHGDMEARTYEDMDTWKHGHGDMDMETWTRRHMEKLTWRHGIKILENSDVLRKKSDRKRKPRRFS